MSNLYLDLDGLFADFDGGFKARFGVMPQSLSKAHKWGAVLNEPNFFRNLPPLEGAIEFFQKIRHLKPIILTGCPHSDYHGSATQKREWARYHLDESLVVLPSLGSRHKYLFMNRPGDVLVDDREDVCALWEQHGGRAVHFTGDYADALSKVQAYFEESEIEALTVLEQIRNHCLAAEGHRRMTDFWRPAFSKIRHLVENTLTKSLQTADKEITR